MAHVHKRHGVYYTVRCACGTEKTVSRVDLRSGRTLSCGCLRRENARRTGAGSGTHGCSTHPLYTVWAGMMSRCYNPRAANYPAYGGRGIRVAAVWHDVRAFIADMHPRPVGLELDRIDNNGAYSPQNCRWANLQTQKANTSRSRFVEYQGRAYTLRELADLTGHTYAQLYRWLLQQGRAVEAILGPAQRRG